jgi:hypothetical protein
MTEKVIGKFKHKASLEPTVVAYFPYPRPTEEPSSSTVSSDTIPREFCIHGWWRLSYPKTFEINILQENRNASFVTWRQQRPYAVRRFKSLRKMASNSPQRQTQT